VDEIESHFDGLLKGTHEAWAACYDDMKAVCSVAIHSIAGNLNEPVLKPLVCDAISKTWHKVADKAWPKRDEDRIAPKLRGYLREAAKNEFLTLCRVYQKAARLSELAPADTLPSITYTEEPSRFFDELSPEELLDEALRQMDPQSGALLKLRIYENQTQQMVANKLGLKLGSMTYNERCALSELKQIYLRLQKGEGDYE
jgi:DNA-directed RNA polymerase specialized sigma24 family protein